MKAIDEMTDSELVEHCGDDAARWAEAFKTRAREEDEAGGRLIDEGAMLGWFANAIESACDKRRRTSTKLSASEAVYGVLAWLTTREQRVTLSARDNAGPAADIASRFCEANGLELPRAHWNANLTHPTEVAGG